MAAECAVPASCLASERPARIPISYRQEAIPEHTNAQRGCASSATFRVRRMIHVGGFPNTEIGVTPVQQIHDDGSA